MMTEMAVDGGILELEEGESLISFVNNESTLSSSPLQLRGGGELQHKQQQSSPVTAQQIRNSHVVSLVYTSLVGILLL